MQNNQLWSKVHKARKNVSFFCSVIRIYSKNDFHILVELFFVVKLINKCNSLCYRLRFTLEPIGMLSFHLFLKFSLIGLKKVFKKS